MGGISVDGGGSGGRKALDSEINMIPMIDLLMVTISFLLITAVWSQMSRLSANAQVPGQQASAPVTPPPPEPQLHVEMRGRDKFVLEWKQAGSVLQRTEIPRSEAVSLEGETRVVRFPELAGEITTEWTRVGAHREPSDPHLDQAILHTDDETPYASVVGAMDAIYQVHRLQQTGHRVEDVPAFNVTFAVN